MKAIKKLVFSLLIFGSIYILLYGGISLALSFFHPVPANPLQSFLDYKLQAPLWFVCLTVICICLIIVLRNRVFNKKNFKKQFVMHNRQDVKIALILIPAIIFTTLSIPALVIAWMLEPKEHKKAVKIGALLVSLGVGLIVYFKIKDSLNSPLDHIAYFTGVLLAPNIIDLLL